MLIGEGQQWSQGEEQAWRELADLDPEDVCRRSQADFDAAEGHYILPLFSDRVFVSPREQRIQANSAIAGVLLNELPHYARVATLSYLLHARDIPPTGNLMNPREIKGVQIFSEGSHVLPLDRIVENYGSSVTAFLEKGLALGGEQLEYGDASLKLLPFPRIPVVIILWQGDEEFPARADILFDDTCSRHLPTDMLWSTAMMTILMMTR